MITSKTKICMVIGDPVDHSHSPQIHNAGYQALGIDFVYVGCRVKPDDIQNFIIGIKALGIKGVSLTSPHKQTVLPFVDQIDETAKEIGAINTIVNKEGTLCGYNTDWLGAVEPLKSRRELKDTNVAVLGAGGAGRALVYGLVREGCNVTIYNRTSDKAKVLSEQFGCNYASLDDIDGISDADIICNTTSVGLNNINESPIDTSAIRSHQIIFDAVYSPIKTKLLTDAESVGATIIYGTEMLLALGAIQFKMFTDIDAPKEAMQTAIMKAIDAR